MNVAIEKLTPEESAHLITAGMNPTDMLYYTAAPIGKLQVTTLQDGTLVVTASFPVPAGMFEFQKKGGLVDASGNAMYDVSTGLASPPIGRFLIKRSGLTDVYKKQLDAAEADLGGN